MTDGDRPSAMDERVLIARIRAGDVEAFSAVYRAYYPGLWRFGTRLLGSEDAGHDLVHIVFSAVWTGRERWNPDSIKAYLYGAVRHESHKATRHEQVVRRTDATVTEIYTTYGENTFGTLPDEATERADLRERIRAIVDRLPDRQRMAMLLRVVDGLTIPEIATAMGISHPPVIRLLAKAQRALRAALDPSSKDTSH